MQCDQPAHQTSDLMTRNLEAEISTIS